MRPASRRATSPLPPRALFPIVVPVTAEVLDRARALMDRNKSLLARDALHAAVVMSQGFEAICSYDGDFDGLPGIVRREPGEVQERGGEVARLGRTP